ncbi:hypothetical protein FSP39_001108 [Pinctada imbricata]|uniref:Uncharacterized protein n=1 Tax=Pinctada imbricata TaxID=66713 RepID=A0AA88XXY9_PINIB|nr:hypothetical protein FSP39_001108 [Pinctada imbricata]
MFVPRARVQIGNPGSRRGWFSPNSSSSKRNKIKHKLQWYECVRMPCLLPTLISIIIGSMVILSGALMSFVGYNPEIFVESPKVNDRVVTVGRNISGNGTTVHGEGSLEKTNESRLKALTYIGPVFMGIGFFIMMVASVLYCEIKDKYISSVLPRKDVKRLKKEALYDMIIAEFRKNYFRGIEVPLKKTSTKKHKKSESDDVQKEFPTLLKALSISQPALFITPEVQRKWQDLRKLTPTPSTGRRRRRRFHSFNEPWLKTSSLPNIRPKPAQVPNNSEEINNQLNNATEISKNGEQSENVIIPENNTDGYEDKTIGFDNPAFRTSPTEKTPKIQISPPTSPESSLASAKVAEVVVHIPEDENKREKQIDPESIGLDKRGYTEKRQSAENKTGDRRTSVVSIEDINLQQKTDNEEKLQRQQLLQCKSDYSLGQ